MDRGVLAPELNTLTSTCSNSEDSVRSWPDLCTFPHGRFSTDGMQATSTGFALARALVPASIARLKGLLWNLVYPRCFSFPSHLPQKKFLESWTTCSLRPFLVIGFPFLLCRHCTSAFFIATRNDTQERRKVNLVPSRCNAKRPKVCTPATASCSHGLSSSWQSDSTGMPRDSGQAHLLAHAAAVTRLNLSLRATVRSEVSPILASHHLAHNACVRSL